MTGKEAQTEAQAKSLKDMLQKNIDAVAQIEQKTLLHRSTPERVADAIAQFCGSITFVWVHVFWFGSWLLINTTHLFPKSFRVDPPPFSILTLVVSLEAIFLSTFILISQNRQQRLADHRNHMDLQINILAEEESSRTLSMLQKIMNHLGIENSDSVAEALIENTDPIELASQIDQTLTPPGTSAPK